MQGTFRQDSLNILSPFLLYLNLQVVFVERLGFPLSENGSAETSRKGEVCVYFNLEKRNLLG